MFINERGKPFGRMGIGPHDRTGWRAAGRPFSVLRHSTSYALAARGMDTRRLQHFLGHASITNTVRYTAMSLEPFISGPDQLTTFRPSSVGERQPSLSRRRATFLFRPDRDNSKFISFNHRERSPHFLSCILHPIALLTLAIDVRGLHLVC